MENQYTIKKDCEHMKPIWYRSKEGNLYMQEELKLYYLENVEFDRFEFLNFLAWIDNKEFVRIN